MTTSAVALNVVERNESDDKMEDAVVDKTQDKEHPVVGAEEGAMALCGFIRIAMEKKDTPTPNLPANRESLPASSSGVSPLSQPGMVESSPPAVSAEEPLPNNSSAITPVEAPLDSVGLPSATKHVSTPAAFPSLQSPSSPKMTTQTRQLLVYVCSICEEEFESRAMKPPIRHTCKGAHAGRHGIGRLIGPSLSKMAFAPSPLLGMHMVPLTMPVSLPSGQIHIPTFAGLPPGTPLHRVIPMPANPFASPIPGPPSGSARTLHPIPSPVAIEPPPVLLPPLERDGGYISSGSDSRSHTRPLGTPPSHFLTTHLLPPASFITSSNFYSSSSSSSSASSYYNGHRSSQRSSSSLYGAPNGSENRRKRSVASMSLPGISSVITGPAACGAAPADTTIGKEQPPIRITHSSSSDSITAIASPASTEGPESQSHPRATSLPSVAMLCSDTDSSSGSLENTGVARTGQLKDRETVIHSSSSGGEGKDQESNRGDVRSFSSSSSSGPSSPSDNAVDDSAYGGGSSSGPDDKPSSGTSGSDSSPETCRMGSDPDSDSRPSHPHKRRRSSRPPSRLNPPIDEASAMEEAEEVLTSGEIRQANQNINSPKAARPSPAPSQSVLPLATATAINASLMADGRPESKSSSVSSQQTSHSTSQSAAQAFRNAQLNLGANVPTDEAGMISSLHMLVSELTKREADRRGEMDTIRDMLRRGEIARQRLEAELRQYASFFERSRTKLSSDLGSLRQSVELLTSRLQPRDISR
eukprot:CAMPEP_0184352280 /NCGR_PEP_ID=MMETSP1089-20130417/63102_1 /TAXON_ID=38269 ORGANISM="Gloeochaete wittrockiana, Strain SAG46.84" /NCGR_SAMPLE_ID=MMETSP1089 /ASSEMBLY_ACC=CAM_ASM_000445 /LENGTH=754 /DNA_ID=CAMNT_0026686573 /DNA_START=62 /DNA_END=2326 /DNA_ORIENTATION=-